MNISGSAIPKVDTETGQLPDWGKTERLMIFAGTAGSKGQERYAITKIEIEPLFFGLQDFGEDRSRYAHR